MIIKTLLMIAVLIFPVVCFAQNYGENLASEDIQMQQVYPANIQECFPLLEENLKGAELEKFKGMEEDEAVVASHRGLGAWIRNEWIRSRPGEPRRPLGEYFLEKGLRHPDDMSSIVLTSFHRYLNGKDIELEEQIKYYQDYWEKESRQQ